MIRTLLADDEPIARAGLREFVRRETDLELVAECQNGEEALGAIATLEPDLILLDVEMPGRDGLATARALGRSRAAVIFITAYQQYALEAFDAHAVDYLLKPVQGERFREAIAKARRWLAGRPGGSAAVPRFRERFLVRAQGRLYFVPVAEVHRLEARGNYARLVTASGGHLVRETMQALEETLDPRQFLRVHRSHIVNLDQVRDFQTFHKGELAVFLKNGTRIPLSRGYRQALETRLGQRL